MSKWYYIYILLIIVITKQHVAYNQKKIIIKNYLFAKYLNVLSKYKRVYISSNLDILGFF